MQEIYVFDNMLMFADLQVAVQKILPIIFNGRFLEILFYLRVVGVVLIIIFIALALFFYFKILLMKKPKSPKIGLSSLDKGSLLGEKELKSIYKKIDDHISFNNILYWKLALAEMDSYFGKVLLEMGFKGADIYEKICKVNEHIDFNMELIKESSIKVSEILDDNNYLLNREETEKLIAIYKEAIEELKKL